jgi:hypothetical protein
MRDITEYRAVSLQRSQESNQHHSKNNTFYGEDTMDVSTLYLTSCGDKIKSGGYLNKGPKQLERRVSE